MTPKRGFDRSEFEARVARAQARMAEHGLAALLLTTEPEVRYFTGYLTRFWESPTRPWFLLIPASGAPIAVIPSIGAELMGQTWISDIRTWRAPDLEDDGVSLLAETIREIVPDGETVGLPDTRRICGCRWRIMRGWGGRSARGSSGRITAFCGRCGW